MRSGAYSLPGPSRRSSAHAATWSGAVAADVAVQLQNGLLAKVHAVAVAAVVVVVSDTLDVRCVWSQRHGDAMSPRTNLHVAGHLGVRLPATPAPRGALDDKKLFIVEGSKNWRSTPG